MRRGAVRATVLAVLVLAALPSLGGCGSRPGGADVSAPRAKTFPGADLAVRITGAPAQAEADDLTQLVARQCGEWEATRGPGAKVAAGAEVLAVSAAAAAGPEVVVFRAERLGDLVDAGALLPIPDAVLRSGPPPAGPDVDPADLEPTPDPNATDPGYGLDDLLPAYRDRVTRYGDRRLALPLGGSGLVLVYRRDAFERDENVAAARSAGIELAPPRTYGQLDALAQFLHDRDWDGDGRPGAGIALALGDDPEGVANAIFLSRAAALGQHPDYFAFFFDDETLEPWIARPPFVTALADLSALKSAGPEGVEVFDADAARKAFREGRAALLIDRAERAAEWTQPGKAVPVGVAPLPGSGRVFDPDRKAWQDIDPPNRPTYLVAGGGWLAGVTAATAAPEQPAAFDFVAYLTGPEASARLLGDRVFPMLPTRAGQLGGNWLDPRRTAGIDARSWSRAVAETMAAPRVVPGLRIAEAEGYLADLDTARRSVIAGGTAPQAALDAATKAWSERSERLGRDRQLWHYRRSLNRQTATADPPPRAG